MFTYKPQKWIPQLMGLDILNVFLALLVQMLGSWSLSVAAILEICKLGVFHPRECLGTF